MEINETIYIYIKDLHHGIKSIVNRSAIILEYLEIIIIFNCKIIYLIFSLFLIS